MINGDHAQPGSDPQCPTCHDRRWIDDMSSARRFLRRCPECEVRSQPVGAAAR